MIKIVIIHKNEGEIWSPSPARLAEATLLWYQSFTSMRYRFHSNMLSMNMALNVQAVTAMAILSVTLATGCGWAVE